MAQNPKFKPDRASRNPPGLRSHRSVRELTTPENLYYAQTNNSIRNGAVPKLDVV